MSLGSHEDSLPFHKRSLSSQDYIISGEITASTPCQCTSSTAILGRTSINCHAKVRDNDLSAGFKNFINIVKMWSLHEQTQLSFLARLILSCLTKQMLSRCTRYCMSSYMAANLFTQGRQFERGNANDIQN